MTARLFRALPDEHLSSPELLHAQRGALDLIALFSRFRDMAAFSFMVESHFSGGDEPILIAFPEAELSRVDPRPPPAPRPIDPPELDGGELDWEEDPLDRALSAFLNARPQAWLLERQGAVFSRPAAAEPFEEALALQFMGPALFSLWQAAALAQSAGPAPDRPGRARPL